MWFIGSCDIKIMKQDMAVIILQNVWKYQYVFFSDTVSFFFVQIMEEGELPWLLVNEIGGIRGILHSHVPFLKKHFHLITMKEFLENRKDIGKKVQAIYLWWHKPVINKELLQSLPNLKVIANSGVGMDHLDLKLVASFGVKMANAPRAVSSSTADTGMALLLASARRLVEGNISILCGF